MRPPAARSPENDGLLAAARAGDRAAFGRLSEMYRAYLKAVAVGVLGRKRSDDCSSVVQEGFCVALEKLEQFRGVSTDEFLGWLARIVKNKAIDRLSELPDWQGAPVDEQLAVQGSSPSKVAAKREETARVLAALDQLPPHYREVIYLRDLKELPFPAVAAAMNRSHDAVRQLYGVAFTRLRKILGDEL